MLLCEIGWTFTILCGSDAIAEHVPAVGIGLDGVVKLVTAFITVDNRLFCGVVIFSIEGQGFLKNS